MSTHKKEWPQHTSLNVFVIHPYLLSCCMCLFEINSLTRSSPRDNWPSSSKSACALHTATSKSSDLTIYLCSLIRAIDGCMYNKHYA